MPILTSLELTQQNQQKTIYADLYTQQQLFDAGLISRIKITGGSAANLSNSELIDISMMGGLKLNNTNNPAVSSTELRAVNTNIAELKAAARRTTIVTVSTPAELPPYTWILIDNDFYVWTSNSDFTVVTNTNVSIPFAANQFTSLIGYGYHATWTGTYWFYYDQSNICVWKSDITLSAWTQVTGITLGPYYGVIATDGNNIVAIASYQKFNLSRDGGNTWTTSSPSAFNEFYMDLMIDNGIFIFTTRFKIFTSIDGITWTERLSTSNQMLSICKNTSNNTYYICGRYKYVTSTDAITWTASSIGTGVTNNIMSDIIWDGTKYIANGLYDGPIWSNDGINWTKWTTTDGSSLVPFDYVKLCLHYNGTSFIYRNQQANTVCKSMDGTVWTSLTHPTAGKKFCDGYPAIVNYFNNIK
jgi:hypothetical protein